MCAAERIIAVSTLSACRQILLDGTAYAPIESDWITLAVMFNRWIWIKTKCGCAVAYERIEVVRHISFHFRQIFFSSMAINAAANFSFYFFFFFIRFVGPHTHTPRHVHNCVYTMEPLIEISFILFVQLQSKISRMACLSTKIVDKTHREIFLHLYLRTLASNIL